MGFYYFFNLFGFIIVFIASSIAACVFIVRSMLGARNYKRKVAGALAAFVLLQVLSYYGLMYDFPTPSAVDLTPLHALGAAHIEDFEGKQAALEDTRFYIRNNDVAYHYAFVYWVKPSVEMTIYRMEDAEEALRNLRVSAGRGHEGDIQQLSDTIYVYLSPSRMWRGKDSFFDRELSRVVDTYFTIDDTLFILHERGAGTESGATTNEVIALLCQTFFPADAAPS